MAGPPPASWVVDPAEASATAVADGVWQLRIPLAWKRISHVNAYAVTGGDGVVLFDCGSAGDPSCEEALARALAGAGIAPEDVATLVLTHAHADHAGIAPWLVRRSGCEVWMHPATEHAFDAIREPDRISAARRRRSRAEGVPADRLADCADLTEELEAFMGVVHADRALTEGAVVPSAVGGWEVFETPGHCPSHVSLVQRQSGLAILGDVACVAFVPWLDYGYSPDPVAEHITAMGRVAALGGGVTGLPGHGRQLEDLPGVAAMYREGLRGRVAATLRAVAQGPAGGWTISRRVFGETENRAEEFAQFVETVCYLRHLRLAGSVVRNEDSDGRFAHALGDRRP